MIDMRTGFIALDEGVGNEGVTLRTIVVAMKVVDRPRDLSILAGKTVVADVAAPLVFPHGVVVAAGFVKAIDKIARDDDAKDGFRKVATAETFRNGLSRKFIKNRYKARVRLFRIGVEFGGLGSLFSEILRVASDEEGVASGFSGERKARDDQGEKKCAGHAGLF